MHRDFKTSGIRVGCIARIDVWLHWTLLILFAFRLYQFWVPPEGQEGLPLDLSLLGIIGLWTLATLLTIFLHELGHCYAAARVGGRADAIVLWPLGGLAYCDAPHTPRAQFWVAAGGPLVNVAIIAALVVVAAMFSAWLEVWPWSGYEPDDYLYIFLRHTLQWNIVILLFNLLPIYPLDGGRIFQSLYWGYCQSYGRAVLATVWASRIAIFVTFFLSFFPPLNDFSWGVFLILIWAFFETERLRQHVLQADDDSLFGYDFSRGYTSLEGNTAGKKRKPRKPSFFERYRKRRLAREREKAIDLRRRVDELLDKISREGMQSLSARERRFLENASRKLNKSKEE